jgi:PadR family transcriptional regulator, regulatory protein PadR
LYTVVVEAKGAVVNPQFNKGVVELCVLALVSKRDFYGYELVEAISSRIEISEGTIYPILRRLTQEKYFETYLQESTEGPPRKYYRMTAQGRKATESLIKEWEQFSDNVKNLIHVGAKK